MAFPELSPSAAHADLLRFRIIDVREGHEFHGPLGHVDGAESVPLAGVAAQLETFSGPHALLLVCRSGKRSAVACQTLQELGVRDVTNLAGGMIAWNEAGLPVVRTTSETLEALRVSIVSWLAQVTGASVDAARSRFDALLVDAGADPSSAALEQALTALEGELREAGAPPDLDLSVDAFRQDLAVL